MFPLGVGLNLRQLGTWAVIFLLSPVTLTCPLWAVERPGAISGYVRDASGVPQMGAVVEIIGTAARTFTVFTDDAGFYSAKNLLPGFYTVKVSAASFLPSWRDKVGLHPGVSTHLNITLNTLLNDLKVGTLRGTPEDDDWKWTLRSVANRPVLRVLDDPSSADKQDHELKASLSFVGGSSNDGYGSGNGSDMSTGFSLERSLFTLDRVGLRGNVAYGDGTPAGNLRATYTHVLPDGSGPSMAVSVRRLSPSDPNLHSASLQAMAFSASEHIRVDDVVELKFGSELQTLQFLGRAAVFRPHGTVSLHLSPNTLVSYSYSTALPEARNLDAFEPGDSDAGERAPRISVDNFAMKVERARHQELSVSHRIGKNSVQFAAFSDRVQDPALLGTGTVTAAGGFLLPDSESGTFTYAGSSLNTEGLRAVLARKLSSDLTATLDYSCGGVLDLAKENVALENARPFIGTQHRQSVAGKLSGTVQRTHTNWNASYRWVNGQALTPVDMFNASPGQTSGYLNVFIRQPIPTLGFLPAHMDALIDLGNLLAQGYVPVMGQDGQTVYLVQSARSVRGGVTISF